MRTLVLSLLIAAPLMACNGSEEAQSPQERACAQRVHPSYNEKILSQCMDVCKACRGGNTVTCSTSCKLKGAS